MCYKCQFVGLVRKECEEEIKSDTSKCKTHKDLRPPVRNYPELLPFFLDSLSLVKSDVISRLQLRGKKFQCIHCCY